jgi:hypothetical protein
VTLFVSILRKSENHKMIGHRCPTYSPPRWCHTLALDMGLCSPSPTRRSEMKRLWLARWCCESQSCPNGRKKKTKQVPNSSSHKKESSSN